MKLYKDIALRKNKIKSNKNSTQHLTKNKSLTYYHIEGKNNNLNNITDIKVNCSNNSGNQIIEYNKNYLLIAYKKGVLELFKALKSYMKKEVYKYNKIKNEFLQNIQKFYNEEKREPVSVDGTEVQTAVGAHASVSSERRKGRPSPRQAPNEGAVMQVAIFGRRRHEKENRKVGGIGSRRGGARKCRYVCHRYRTGLAAGYAGGAVCLRGGRACGRA